MSASSVLYDAPGPRARRLSRIASTVILVALAALGSWFVWRIGQPRTTVNGAVLSGVWDPSRWDIFTNATVWEDLILRGLVMGTLRAAGLAAVLALILGVLLCFARSAKSAYIRIPTAILLEFFRGLPVLLMMLFIMLAVGTNGYWAVVAALTIYNGAIIGEALRAGIAALPKGQREAGLSLGLTGTATKLLIEFPQAFRQMLPIIVAQLVVLLKDTSLAYVVAYPEILRKADSLKQFYGNRYAFSLFFVVLVIYLIVNFTLSALARWLSKRTGPKSDLALVTQSTRSADAPAGL